MRKKVIYTNPGGTEFREVPASTRSLTQEIATRDTALDFSSVLGWLPNPDPVLSLQNGQAGMDILTDLMADAHVAGAIGARKAATLSLEWMLDLEGVEDDFPEQVLRPWLETMDVPRIVSDILEAPLYGNQPLESIWEFSDVFKPGLVLPTDLIAKPPEWFFFDRNNQLRFRHKDGAQTGGMTGSEGMELPPRKFLVAQYHPSYKNPYGQPVLSKCYWPVVFKRGGFRFWVTYVEKYGMPFVLAMYDTTFYNVTEQPDPAKPHVSQLLSELDSMAQDGVFVHPKQGLELQILNQGPAARADNYQQLIAEANREISKAILGHGAALDSTSGKLGNENMAQLASQEVTQADKQLVENIVNQWIGWVYELNFQPKGKRARFVLFQEQEVDKLLAERDKVLFDMGIRFTSEYVEKTYDIPADMFTIVDEAANLVGGAVAELAGEATTQLDQDNQGDALDPEQEQENPDQTMDTFSEKCDCPACRMARQAGGVYFTAAGDYPDQMAIDQLGDQLTPELLQFQAEQMNQVVFEIMADAATKPDPYTWAQTELAKRFPQTNSSALEKVMASALFIGNTLGRHSVETEAQNG